MQIQDKARYKRVTDEERDIIAIRLANGYKQSQIALELNRHPATISREIRRNRYKCGDYVANRASKSAHQALASRKKGKHKLKQNKRLWEYVEKKLYLFWSPEQIAYELIKEYPLDMNMRVSPETIYRYLYIRPSKELRRLLRLGRLRRRKVGRPKKTEKRGKIPDMTMIDERPKEVESRLVPGHWEGDVIKGKYNKSALGTLVERTTRYTILVPLTSFNAETVRKSFAKELTSLPEDVRKTLTYDQGKEMSEHLKLTLDTDIQVYFAHEGSPWERGTNENTNGLIRQFFPKGTDFTKVPRRKIKRAQALLNGRPRKTLDFKKPDEVLLEVLR